MNQYAKKNHLFHKDRGCFDKQLPCFAQTYSGTNVSGIVTDRDHIPLENATVILLQANDSSFITGVATNRSGEFTIPNVKPQQYILNLSMLGYDRKYKTIVERGALFHDR